MKENIDIIIADDHALFSDGVEQVLRNTSPLFNIRAKVGDGKKLMQLLNSKVPDLILLDINMPFIDGIESATIIKKRFPAIKIIVVSMLQTKAIAKQLQEIGVEGYIGKDMESLELVTTINEVLNGKKIFKEHNTHFYFQPGDTTQSELLQYNLTPREKEILLLISKGYSTKKICSTLSIAEFTVSTHRKNIARKTGLSTIVEMVAFANKIFN